MLKIDCIGELDFRMFLCPLFLHNFERQLMKVLSQSEYSDIISWLPDGKSFNILKPKAFVAEILPDHFKQAKYSSFTRKLHRWGFQRHLRGEEAGAFYHNLFQRGMPDLLDKMTCYKSSDMIKHSLPLNNRENVASSEKYGMFDDFQLVNKSLHQKECSQEKLHHASVMQGDLQHKMQTCSKSFSNSAESSVSRLNAAIELEVSRRFKERSSSINFSRQNLPIMQQPHFPVSNNDLTYGGHMFFSNGMNFSNNSLGKL
jgi:HSF-type DNA-binding